MIKAALIALALGGCTYERGAFVDEYYNRSEVNAINAEAQCKALARTLVQISRCEIGRR